MARPTIDSWEPSGIDRLEPAAWDALHYEGSTFVTAGPGAGKTEFLAQRACYLLETGVCRNPKRILAISFKRDAAKNLGQRVQRRAPADAPRFVSMTFDAFTKSIVDRFRAALPAYWAMTHPYDIQFFRPRLIESFLDRLGASDPTWTAEVAGLNRKSFFAEHVGGQRLPINPGDPVSVEQFAVWSWWDTAYRTSDPHRVDFVMLNRLAELIVRTNPQIQRALRLTYPFVFVDEFQDTTFAQYDFLLSVFGGNTTTVTAVGDNKQRIMGFAGAMHDAFTGYQTDFEAEPFNLRMNFRSSEPLIAIQHVFAQVLDTSSTLAVSGSVAPVSADAAHTWLFDSEQEEAQRIAQWIADDIRQSGRAPSDYALLARQQADTFESLFGPALAAHGIALRNDSQKIGKSTLQDVLVDELTVLILGLARLAASTRNPVVWDQVCSTMTVLRGADPDDERAARAVIDEVSAKIKRVRAAMNKTPPTRETATQLCDSLLKFVDRDAVRRMFVTYRAADMLEIAEDALRARLQSVCHEASTWLEACDEFEGVNAVPLMTVHKSKGLEYHTVVFLGIDDNQWWAHTPGEQEGLSTFFVGLSRAEQRARFTFCEQRGDRVKVRELYELLAQAGVSESRFS